MAQKGQLTKSSYLPMHEMVNVIRRMKRDGNWKFALYFMFSTAVALRVKDVLSTRWVDIIYIDALGQIKARKKFHKKESKTKKIRTISFSESTKDAIIMFYKKLDCPDMSSYLFVNKNNGILSSQYLNAEIKRIKNRYNLNIENFSTHTFRKTFGRDFWERSGRSSSSLILLSDIFNHSSLGITRKYLGITDSEIEEVYIGIEF